MPQKSLTTTSYQGYPSSTGYPSWFVLPEGSVVNAAGKIEIPFV